MYVNHKKTLIYFLNTYREGGTKYAVQNYWRYNAGSGGTF